MAMMLRPYTATSANISKLSPIRPRELDIIPVSNSVINNAKLIRSTAINTFFSVQLVVAVSIGIFQWTSSVETNELPRLRGISF